MRRVVALVGCLCVFLQGCTVMQAVPVPSSGSAPPAVRVGDTVEATTVNGEVKRFKVTGVTDEELIGADARVAYPEVATLKVARQDERSTRTVLWLLGGAALAALLIAAGGGSGSSY